MRGAWCLVAGLLVASLVAYGLLVRRMAAEAGREEAQTACGLYLATVSDTRNERSPFVQSSMALVEHQAAQAAEANRRYGPLQRAMAAVNDGAASDQDLTAASSACRDLNLGREAHDPDPKPSRRG